MFILGFFEYQINFPKKEALKFHSFKMNIQIINKPIISKKKGYFLRNKEKLKKKKRKIFLGKRKLISLISFNKIFSRTLV